MKKVLSIALAAVLLVASVFTFASCKGENIEEEPVNTGLMSISLCSAEGIEPRDGAVASQKLTAVVEPANAEVDIQWEVYWIENPFDENAKVTSYVTVTPDDQNPREAVVSAMQAFRGAKIGVRATANPGNFQAECQVSFLGAPDFLNATVTTDSFQEQLGILYNDEGRTELPKMTTSERLTIEVFTSNEFGSSTTTGSNTPCLISENMKMKIDVEGTIKMNHTSIMGTTYVMTMRSGLEPGEEEYDPTSAFFTAFKETVLDYQFGLVDEQTGCAGGYVELNLNETVETYAGTYTYAEGIENLRFIVTITDSENGLVGTFSFSYLAAANSFVLDNQEIVF